MLLVRRFFKRGFNNIFKKVYIEVNVEVLNRFENGIEIIVELLKFIKIISKIGKDGIKILGEGNLEKVLIVKVVKFIVLV